MLSGLLLHLRVLLLSTCCLLTDAGFMGECYYNGSFSHDPLVCPDCKATAAPKKTLSGVNLTTSPRRVQLYSRRVTCTAHAPCRTFYDYDSWAHLTESLAVEGLDEDAAAAEPPKKERVEEGGEAAPNAEQEAFDVCDMTQDFRSSLHLRLPASIANLRGLRKLSLCGVFKLTDHSLMMAFHFPDLLYLNLSQCAQHCSLLTSDSLDSLQWRPSLRYLDITQCTSMTQSAVEQFAMHCTHVKLVTLNTQYLQPPSTSPADVRVQEEVLSAQVLTSPPQPPPMPLMTKVKRRIFRPWMR